MKVIVLKANTNPPLLQNYAQCEIHQNAPDISPAKFFNDELRDLDTSAIYCLLNNDDFTSENVVELVVQKFGEIDDLFGIIYADQLIDDGQYVNRLYHQSFHPHFLLGNYVINSPVFAKADILKGFTFDESIISLHFYYALFQLAQKAYLYHYQKPLFISKYDSIDLQEIQHIKRICLEQ